MIKLLIYSRIIVYLLSSAQSSGGDPNSAMCTKGTKLIMKGNNNDKKKKEITAGVFSPYLPPREGIMRQTALSPQQVQKQRQK